MTAHQRPWRNCSLALTRPLWTISAPGEPTAPRRREAGRAHRAAITATDNITAPAVADSAFARCCAKTEDDFPGARGLDRETP
jgi:hypothetical protein